MVTPTARQRVDDHLDAVERELAAMPRQRRRAIVDDLEAQIVDMLGWADLSAVRAEQVDAVLARLDPPAAYAAGDAAPPPPAVVIVKQPEACPEARRAARWLAVAVPAAAVVLAFHVGRPAGGVVPHDNFLATLASAAAAAVAVWGLAAATALGWRAVVRIRRSGGRLRGAGHAVAAVAALPLLLIVVGTSLGVLFVGVKFHRAHPHLVSDQWLTLVLLAGWMVIASALAWSLLRHLLRYARRTPTLTI